MKQDFRSKEEVCIEAVRKAKKIAEQKVDAVHFLSAQSYEPLITGGT